MNQIKDTPDQNSAPDEGKAPKSEANWESANQGEARKGPAPNSPSGEQEAQAKKDRNAAMDKRYLKR